MSATPPSRRRGGSLGISAALSARLAAANLPAEIPRDRLPERGLGAASAYELIHDHLMLDGNARLNLATFVGTWMEPEARQLLEECADKNIIDKDEYPQTAELEQRCLRILADLWHAPDPDRAVGTSTTGSSEGCMLGGLVVGQHFNFLHLGREGYAHRMAVLEAIACHLADGIAALPPLRLLSHPLGQLPVFAVELEEGPRHWSVFHLSDKLRERGWQVPAYTLPADCQARAVLRFVVRAGFSRDMAEALLDDIARAVQWFERLEAPLPRAADGEAGFHH